MSYFLINQDKDLERVERKECSQPSVPSFYNHVNNICVISKLYQDLTNCELIID
jgi:hypothetical protein